jgi:quercetin dioxygenase-like cupin family protein
MKSIPCLVASIALLLVACGPSETPEVVVDDIVQAAPDSVELLLDNDYVTVTRFTVPSQVRIPRHQGGARIVYPLSSYKLRWEIPGYEASVRDFQEGTAQWSSAGEHAFTNAGATTARFLVVTRKVPNPTPGVTSNVAELDPDHATVVFENQSAKVIEVSLEPGDALPEHEGASRVVYSLTPSKVKMTLNGETTEADYAEGDAHWHDGGVLSVENISEAPIRYLVFELM